MTRNDDTLGEFRVFAASRGHLSAMHVPSGVLLHSAVDPITEARELAQECATTDAPATVLLGGGLGYLAEAIAENDPRHIVHVIEPDPALAQLARGCRPGSPYANSSSIRIMVAATSQRMMEHTAGISGAAALIVAPYFERIASYERLPLAGFLQILRSERASQAVYRDLLPQHRLANATRLAGCARALDVRLQRGQTVVVVGAGPSLNECTTILRRYRDQLVIVAASGAAPPLSVAGIQPDWVVVMEAREAAVTDLADLAPSVNVIGFECTHPRALDGVGGNLFNGAGLETRGGTTIIPALDFALRCSNADVAIVGVDLGQGRSEYAAGARRAFIGETATPPPKFTAMRAALESLMDQRCDAQRKVFHVLRDAAVLRGTQRLDPAELERMLAARAITKEMSWTI